MGYFKKGFVTALGACFGITVYRALDKCVGMIIEDKSEAENKAKEKVSESNSEETE